MESSAFAPADVDPENDRRDGQMSAKPVTKSKPSRNLTSAVAQWTPPIIALVVVVLIWEAAVRIGEIPAYLLPPPSLVLIEMWHERTMFSPHIGVTAVEIALGYLYAVAIGLPLAILISSSKIMERSVFPLLVASQVVPKVALAPLFLIYLGFGIASKLTLVMVIAFFPIVVNGALGLQSIEREKIYLARSMGAGPFKTFWRVRLPHALPATFGGLRLAATLAPVGAIIGEFIGANAGLGVVLLQAQGMFNITRVFAAIAFMTVLGIAFYVVVLVAEQFAIPWHISKRSTST